MIKHLQDEIKWRKWRTRSDATLGYCWPSDDSSEGESAASESPVTVGKETAKAKAQVREDDYCQQIYEADGKCW